MLQRGPVRRAGVDPHVRQPCPPGPVVQSLKYPPTAPGILMRTLPIALAFLLLPGPGLAQARRAAPPLPPPAMPAPAAFAPAPDGGLLDQALRLAGGALAGAWVGFMASQVAVSDWDDGRTIDRSSWAAGGAAFGAAVGFTLPAGPRRAPAPRAERPGRDVLTLREIREARGSSLYQVIRSLRPEWLRVRGTASMRETPRGRTTGPDPDDVAVQPGIPTIRVYLDDARIGDIDDLRLMPPGSVGEVRFLDAAEATHRWGAGHLHGAIHVITAPAS